MKQHMSIRLIDSDVKNAVNMTRLLYRMVDEEKIEYFKIGKIKKGNNSIDINSFVPFAVDVEELISMYSTTIFSIGVGSLAIMKTIKQVREELEKAMIAYEKLTNELSPTKFICKVKNRIFLSLDGANRFDTLMTSAVPETVANTLLAKNEWGEIPIALEKFTSIKYLAFYVKSPVRAIEWIAEVKDIKYNILNKKSTVYFKGPPQKIDHIPYDPNCPHYNGHGAVYTTKKLIENAKKLPDVYPSFKRRIR